MVVCLFLFIWLFPSLFRIPCISMCYSYPTRCVPASVCYQQRLVPCLFMLACPCLLRFTIIFLRVVSPFLFKFRMPCLFPFPPCPENMARPCQATPWQPHRNTLQYHGTIIGTTTQPNGTIIAFAWQERGSRRARSWQKHGNIMPDHCNSMATSWREHGRNMTI